MLRRRNAMMRGRGERLMVGFRTLSHDKPPFSEIDSNPQHPSGKSRMSNGELDASRPVARPCLRRVRALENAGVIQNRGMLDNAPSIWRPVLCRQPRLQMTGVRYRRAGHHETPEGLECYLRTGDADTAAVVVPDVSAYEHFCACADAHRSAAASNRVSTQEVRNHGLPSRASPGQVDAPMRQRGGGARAAPRPAPPRQSV